LISKISGEVLGRFLPEKKVRKTLKYCIGILVQKKNQIMISFKAAVNENYQFFLLLFASRSKLNSER